MDDATILSWAPVFRGAHLSHNKDFRLAIANENIPGMVSQMTAILAENNINIVDMLNKSRGDYAYTLIDINEQVSPELFARLISIKGVLSVRALGYLANNVEDNEGT